MNCHPYTISNIRVPQIFGDLHQSVRQSKHNTKIESIHWTGYILKPVFNTLLLWLFFCSSRLIWSSKWWKSTDNGESVGNSENWRQLGLTTKRELRLQQDTTICSSFVSRNVRHRFSYKGRCLVETPQLTTSTNFAQAFHKFSPKTQLGL